MSVPYKGLLDENPFVEIFGMIAGEDRSGVLTLANAETREIAKRIGFKNGRQSYVSGGAENETIGQLLLKWGKITQPQLDKCLQLQQQKNMKAGEALIQLKIVSPKDMADALERQVEEKIVGCFGLKNHIYSFLEAEPPSDKHILFFMIIPEKIIIDGIRASMTDAQIQNRLTPYARSKFNLAESFDKRKDLLQIPPKGIRIFSIIKNGVTITDILGQGGIDPSSALKIIYALITSRMLIPDSVMEQHIAPPPPPPPPPAAPEPEQPAYEPPPLDESSSEPAVASNESTGGSQFGVEGEEPAPTGLNASFEVEGEPSGETAAASAKPAAAQHAKAAPEKPKPDVDKDKQIEAEISNYEKTLKEGNYFELLGVERSASAADIKKAYFKLAKKFHPDTNPDFFKGEFRDKAEHIFTVIGDAYAVLSDQQKRDDYVFQLDNQISKEDLERAQRMLESDSIFAKAEIMFKKGDFRTAQTLIEEAIALNPDEPENYVYLGWCIYKNTKGSGIREARNKIERAINMGLKEKLDVAHYYLGMLAKVENLPLAQQEKHFADVLAISPKHPLATSEMRRIKTEKEKGGSGASKDGSKEEKKKGGFFDRFKK